MKNACIVWKNQRNGCFDGGVSLISDALRRYGYVFTETRTLFQADEKTFVNAVEQLLAAYENVFVITDENWLIAAKTNLSVRLGEENFQGIARGAGIFTKQNKSCFLLSVEAGETGVAYVESTCMPYLERKYGFRKDRTVIRSVGANEQFVRNLIAKAQTIDEGKMQYFYTRKYDEDVLEIVYDENVSKKLERDVVRIFAEGLDDSVYAMEDTPLAAQLVQMAKLRGKRLSVAESFTGGGMARRIVSVSGASEIYFEGLNTYNELSKIKRLGVGENTLQTFGAVSEHTAYEMAAGLIATGDCDVSIATTGLAGPKSDRTGLPVGLCYIAVGTKERVFVYRYKFDGTREEITEKAINYALFLAYKQLKVL